ncbi:hypothetical protein [Endozoicomonas sp. GU-1]|uniref:hypothetical protein n=1 Tax=Endozoicomonas sp. GU-1 TaxID=3009078 RepID=UPI0022B42BF2|nr:hypothetical protein [Endozoicomonas sp. GU-1]WBA85732.1 hypothetical protein O3276_21300 [Endozoicomonas sp. GU-1]
MNKFNIGSNIVPGYYQLQDFLTTHLTPTNNFNLQPRITNLTVQENYSVNFGYLNRQAMNQDTPFSPRLLNDFSISHLPPTENELLLPELLPEYINGNLSCDFASGLFDDDFLFTDSTFTNSQQTGQEFPWENSSASFSQPSLRTVNMADLFNKDTQAQVTTETIEFKTLESPRFAETVPFSLAIAQGQSGKSTVSTRDRAQSEKKRAYKRAWAQSEKGKATLKAYRQSSRGKATKRAWAQSKRGKASKRAWAQSEKGKAYYKAYTQLENRKAYARAYYKVLRNTGDYEQARIAANQASDFIKELNKTKKQ